MNPRTPYGVRLGYVQNKIFSVRLKSTHSIRSATCCRKSGGSTYQHLNPRTPYGVRRVELPSDTLTYKLKSTHSIRSATAILYKKYSLFIQIAFIFWTNCLSEKNIIVFSKGLFFLSSANLPGFSCSLPIRTT